MCGLTSFLRCGRSRDDATLGSWAQCTVPVSMSATIADSIPSSSILCLLPPLLLRSPCIVEDPLHDEDSEEEVDRPAYCVDEDIQAKLWFACFTFTCSIVSKCSFLFKQEKVCKIYISTRVLPSSAYRVCRALSTLHSTKVWLPVRHSNQLLTSPIHRCMGLATVALQEIWRNTNRSTWERPGKTNCSGTLPSWQYRYKSCLPLKWV